MLRDFFPNTITGAEIYGGSLANEISFFKFFDFVNPISDLLDNVNAFLLKNGYDKLLISDFDSENEMFESEFQPVKLVSDPYQKDKMILYIERELTSKSESNFLINELKKFRNERDWEQFHNTKDLSIALSIEANELLELFLWKKPEDANLEKVKEELADVFAYAFLIAEKYNLNVEEIVLDKIKKNAEKYPVEKSKGIATKYDNL
jgi:NTP pyrophosphatase (non-canonical NTP hydrolase)